MDARYHFRDLSLTISRCSWRTMGLLTLGSIALFLVALMAISESAEGATVYVDDDGGADYSTIQEAIDGAAEDDTIRIHNGTYRENLVVDSTVELIGNGSGSTLIEGNGSGDVVIITADGVHLEGLSITGSGGEPHSALNVTSGSNILNDLNCSNNSWNGIMLYHSNGNSLTNNTCLNNSWNGIHLYHSNNNYIGFNDCSFNYREGIYLNTSFYNTIANNNCSSMEDDTGILLSLSEYNTIVNNICSQNEFDGIRLSRSHHNNVTDNLVEDNEQSGLHLVNASHNILHENICSDSSWPGLFLAHSSQNMFINNTFTKTWSHNIYLKFSDHNSFENNNASSSHDGAGIYLYVSHNNTLAGNDCWKNHDDGIWLDRSHDNQITGNRADENDEHGIGLDRSHRNSISWNNISATLDHGLYFEGSNDNDILYNNASSSRDSSGIGLYQSDNNTIAYNDCWANAYTGIWLESSNYSLIYENNAIENGNSGIGIELSGNLNIYLNRCLRNNGPGIWLNLSHENYIQQNNCSGSLASSGIYLLDSEHNSLTYNTGNENEYSCIWLAGSDDNYLNRNFCEDNKGTGIGLDDSHHNTISMNTIIGNMWGFYLGYSDFNTLSWNTVQESQLEGAYLYDASNNSLSENEFLDNNDGLTIAQLSADNTIVNNDIVNNTVYGIDASSNNGVTVKAENNWWGDPTGPYNFDDNPDGEGDSASVDVDFTPWLTAVYNSQPVAVISRIEPDSILEAEAVIMSGMGFDNDGTIVAYQWVSDIDGGLSDQRTYTADNLTPGDHVISFQVQDNEGLWSRWDYAAVEVNGRPVVKVTKPLPNAKVGKIIIIDGTAEDDGTVTLVEVTVDDGDWQPASGTGEWTFAWDISKLKDGAHTIKVRAYDGQQYSEVVSVEVKVDEERDDDERALSTYILLIIGLIVILAATVLVMRRKEGQESYHPEVSQDMERPGHVLNEEAWTSPQSQAEKPADETIYRKNEQEREVHYRIPLTVPAPETALSTAPFDEPPVDDAWGCPNCEAKNAIDDAFCCKCGKQKGELKATSAVVPQAEQTPSRPLDIKPTMDENWECSKCEAKNVIDDAFCCRCGTKLAEPEEAPATAPPIDVSLTTAPLPPISIDENWSCLQCGGENSHDNVFCRKCGIKR